MPLEFQENKPMTLAEIHNSPTGTMAIVVRENRHSLEKGTAFIATHYEKLFRAVQPRDFYGETAEIARAKAEAHDKRRKELRASWKNGHKKRMAARS